jgi:glycosyltransferase involved in cell wall biosynthesis
VLSCDLIHDQKAYQIFKKNDLKKNVVFSHSMSDKTLEWIYRNGAALAFTSNIEGNFPTQLSEALAYNTPIVATKIPVITERLECNTELLLLSEPDNYSDYLAKLIYCIDNVELVKKNQLKVRELIAKQSSLEQFKEGIMHTLDLI